ncbi:CGNR zinc finger domain-containing protein [Saccharomonospora saliphila]|uniref:CGNR zinc finger domain-containing protein n=1 Tax=Saccharomonospora saliphila TaxID=369829 RepID=UPI0003681E9F|nr:CGNR zinc finger domain-containing protein [Saccharomonospora saliphila]
MSLSRTDAPGELRRLEELCNSARLLATEDALITPASASAWLRAQEVAVGEVTRKEHELLLRVRETVRDHLGGRHVTDELNKLARTLLTAPRWSPAGEPVLPPRKSGALETYLAEILAATFSAGLTGELERLRTCEDPECRSVFYDRSPGRNTRWCSLDLCTARRASRPYRSRHGG